MMNTRNETVVKFWRKRIVILGGAAGLLLLAGLGLLAWFAAPVLAGPKLSQLTLSGRLQHVQPAAVLAAVQPSVGSGFFTTDVDKVSAAVTAVPWVAQADVRRQWPHTLYISVTEEVPVARWNGDGLMDAQGRVFVHSTDPAYAALPALSGREGSEQDVLAQYDTLQALMVPRGLAIATLAVDARGAATLLLDDGIEVRLGREDAEARLARFSSVALPALGAKLATVAYVDMRYTNGFAVGWKTAGGAQARQGA